MIWLKENIYKFIPISTKTFLSTPLFVKIPPNSHLTLARVLILCVLTANFNRKLHQYWVSLLYLFVLSPVWGSLQYTFTSFLTNSTIPARPPVPCCPTWGGNHRVQSLPHALLLTDFQDSGLTALFLLTFISLVGWFSVIAFACLSVSSRPRAWFLGLFLFTLHSFAV